MNCGRDFNDGVFLGKDHTASHLTEERKGPPLHNFYTIKQGLK